MNAFDESSSTFNTKIVSLAVKISDLDAVSDDVKLEMLARVSQIAQAHFDDMQNYLSDAFLSLGLSIGRPIDKPDETGETGKTS